MKNTIEMTWVKSTKGTHVYTNDEADTPVSTIYIKRSGLPSAPPESIQLSIEYDDNES